MVIRQRAAPRLGSWMSARSRKHARPRSCLVLMLSPVWYSHAHPYHGLLSDMDVRYHRASHYVFSVLFWLLHTLCKCPSFPQERQVSIQARHDALPGWCRPPQLPHGREGALAVRAAAVAWRASAATPASRWAASNATQYTLKLSTLVSLTQI